MISDTGVELKSDILAGKTVGVGVSGGIAAVEVIKIVREIRRYGADVSVFGTPDSARFVTEDSLTWAAQKSPQFEPSPLVDHLGHFDVVVIAPATLNTLSKASQGICDNVVLLLIAAQLGDRRPVLFVPTMNSSLRAHPLYDCFVDRLSGWGAQFLESSPVEGRVKMPSAEDVRAAVCEIVK